MKLFWKLFITMMCVIILFFMISCNILVHTAFQTMLNREAERGIEEIKIFQYALLASLEGLPKDYQATDKAVAEITKSFQQSLNNAQSTIVIYNSQNKVIYRNSSLESNLIKKANGSTSGIWQIAKHGNHYYMESLCQANSSKERYTLEVHRKIDHIYQDRDLLYERYHLTLILVFAGITVILFLFSIHFTRPVRKLSQVTRSFAQGNYKSRIRERGHDEVALLGQDFNRMAGQIEENIVELKENARRKEEFTEAFSHELKTPLTSIIGYADMLRSRNMSTEEIISSADYIFHQGKRLERLAMKMMELIYIDRQSIQFQEIDITLFINKVKIMTEPILQKKGIRLECQAESGLLHGDLDLLLSLFSNLIDNARKACSEKGNILLSGHPINQGYFFAIKDDGRGMPEEEIHKITEPFYMIDKSRARKEGGAGIGMTLCQKIISLHQAEWTIESRPNQGTEVKIIFQEYHRERKESDHEANA